MNTSKITFSIHPSRLTARFFSLIELLVVVAVVLILLTLILPSFQNTFQKTKSLQCSTRLKQVIDGYVNLVDDYEGGRLAQYRDYRYDEPNTPVHTYWSARIRKYIFKGETVLGFIKDGITPLENMSRGGLPFICPYDKFFLECDGSTPGKFSNPWRWVTEEDVTKYSSYGLNVDGAGIAFNVNTLPPMKTQIQIPEQFLVMADSGYAGIDQYLVIDRSVPNDTISLNFSQWKSLFGISRHGRHSQYDLTENPEYTALIPEMETSVAYLDSKTGSEKVETYTPSSPDYRLAWWGSKHGGWNWWGTH